jgi:hypothetical protein
MEKGRGGGRKRAGKERKTKRELDRKMESGRKNREREGKRAVER